MCHSEIQVHMVFGCVRQLIGKNHISNGDVCVIEILWQHINSCGFSHVCVPGKRDPPMMRVQVQSASI